MKENKSEFTFIKAVPEMSLLMAPNKFNNLFFNTVQNKNDNLFHKRKRTSDKKVKLIHCHDLFWT